LFPDPVVIVAEVGKSLIFDFDFDEPGLVNDDEFAAILFDPAFGVGADLALVFFDASAAGTITFDLSPYATLNSDPFDGLGDGVLGLSFQLNRLFFDPGDGSADDSTVTITDLHTTSSTIIPLPSAAWMGLGLLGLLGLGRLARRS